MFFILKRLPALVCEYSSKIKTNMKEHIEARHLEGAPVWSVTFVKSSTQIRKALETIKL